MLMSMTYRFIFIANLKTGSTAIEEAIAHHADIRLLRTEWGKHMGIGEIESRFSWLFSEIPFDEYTVIGVTRDPIEWLISIYRSHLDPKFDGVPVSTAGMSFDEFLDTWCEANSVQILPQTSRFIRSTGVNAVTRHLRYETLAGDLNKVLQELKLPPVTLTRANASPSDAPFPVIGQEAERFIRHTYDADYRFRESP